MSVAPLADIRVLAVEQFGPGPWGTLQLADLGAEVIKIENPSTSGDVGRHLPPYQEGESSLFFETFNRNKRSASLDPRRPDSRRVFEDLVRECDAEFAILRDVCGYTEPQIAELRGDGVLGDFPAEGEVAK